MLERRSIHNLDWLLAFAVLSLCAAGMGMVYSATLGGPLAPLAAKQMIYFAVGLAAMGLALTIDYHTLASLSYLFYAGSLVLLHYLLAAYPLAQKDRAASKAAALQEMLRQAVASKE